MILSATTFFISINLLSIKHTNPVNSVYFSVQLNVESHKQNYNSEALFIWHPLMFTSELLQTNITFLKSCLLHAWLIHQVFKTDPLPEKPSSSSDIYRGDRMLAQTPNFQADAKYPFPSPLQVHLSV